MQCENRAAAYVAKWRNHSIADVLERAVFVADSTASAALPDIVEACLVLLPNHHPVDNSTLRSFAALFKRLGLLNASVVPVILHYIDSLPDPLPFINILPSLIVPNTQVVTLAFDTLRSLLFTDVTFTLPILNVLVDLPLSSSQKSDVTITMEEALSSVEESDVPFLVRSLLKSMMSAPNTFTLRRMRYEVGILHCT